MFKKRKAAAAVDEWRSEEELLADIDHFRTDFLHNGADEAQLLSDIEQIDKLKGHLESSMLKRVRQELEQLASIPQGERREEMFRDMIHNVLEEQLKTRKKMQ